eukprot:TRINITY_DN160694_c0_g1_i1.p2 TRINITY_DN160694_c0_g1~~TRINITY_DN160694_c0_g1_i1.p2  ORF type:complete len:114 (+),score=32.09 TRINITY_DN160694_c0_g1_i1:81-422(+)
MALKYVSAYLMSVLGGKNEPSKKDIEAILGSVGADVEAIVLDAFLGQMKGKTTHEVIKEGLSKLQVIPTGGGGGGGGAPAAAAAAPSGKDGGGKPPAKEEEEEDADMGFSLFD